MRAVAYEQNLPIDHPDALVDVELPKPEPGERDLLVRIEAVSVNPVDTKVRRNFPTEGPRVLGWDAVGKVVGHGAGVSRFQNGDRVWYAGALMRPGTNAEFHCVDERLVSSAPKRLAAEHAAAMPLTTITAWEMLFEKLAIPRGDAPHGHVLLVSGAAGGVGSILLQLASRLTAATVIATAGREASRAWVTSLGADHVIDYREPLRPQIEALGFSNVSHVVSLTQTDQHFASFVDVLAPFGHLALIDDPPALEIGLMKRKSLSLHWEFMYTRSMFETADMPAQGALLGEVADLLDAGVLKSTFQESLGTICAANVREAHDRLERGVARGKLVLHGFPS